MNVEQLTIDGVTYEVREQTMRVLLPILSGPSEEIPSKMLSSCVYLNGECIGDGVLDFGFTGYQELMAAANRVHNLDDGIEAKKPED